MIGQNISHYEITEKLGEGGMGVVYKARDTHLDRFVAIKVLPPERVADPERKRRFVQEAKAASALNHPNIVTIHDIDQAEVGHASRLAAPGGPSGPPILIDFIAMEYVEGKTLGELIGCKGLKLSEALKYTVQIADALAKAHAAGIVHRDLKPGNVMVTAEGRVKVLDFGLAKLTEPASVSSEAPTVTEQPSTETGVIVGTVSYMSPEQAEGKKVDARSDIFSFGSLLYETVTGRRAFRRDSPVLTMAAILELEPPPLPGGMPHDLEQLLARCLRKEPDRRIQHMDDVKIALEELKADSDSGKLAGIPATKRKRRLMWPAVASVATVLIALGLWLSRRPASIRSGLPRTEFSQLTSGPGIEWFPSLSPDGKWLVYGGTAASGRHIYLQAVGGQNTLDLTRDSTAADDQPVFSPDGERIAFRSSRGGGGIFVMGRTGEAVRRLTNMGFNPSWSPDGAYLAFTTDAVELYPQNTLARSELWTVAVNTGETRRLSEGDAVLASWSPHNLRIAYTGRLGHPVQGDVWTIPVAGGTPTRVTSDPARDWNPAWSPDGKYLYFASDRSGSMNLWRVRINEASGKTLGEPEPITTPAPYFAHGSLSADGKRIVYTSALITANIQQLTLDASGATKEETAWVTTGSRRWSSPDPSPDGEWVAFYSLTQPEGHLYVQHPDGTGLRQITEGAIDRVPRWSPDSKWIACFSDRSHRLELWKIRPDASGLQQLTEGGFSYFAWSPDGSRIATNSWPSERVTMFDPNRPWKEQTPEMLPPFDPPSDRFLVNSWSPDGRRLVGQVDGEHPGIAIYSLAPRAYERLADFGEWPVWLPDSRRVLFVANGSAFYILDTRSRQIRKILSVTGDVIGPPRLTPDGKKAYYSRRVTEADVWLCTLR